MSDRAAFVVGVTGHRPNRLAIGGDAILARLTTALRASKYASRGSELVALSALAEGSDRLFAQTALALGFRLHALLPFASVWYETTFSEPGTTDAYHGLLARAARVEELPGTLADSPAAYEAMGHIIVARADVMIAIWDGKPSAGRGGTPEIIEHALSHGVPGIWIDAARDRKPRLLRPSLVQGRPVVRETVLTRSRLVRLSRLRRRGAKSTMA